MIYLNTKSINLLVLSLTITSNLYAAEARIIGGNNSPNNAYPFIAAIEYFDNEEQFCAGTLITPTKILTAAHCVKQDQQLQVRLGSSNNKKSSATQIINIVKQSSHPKFNPLTLDYDVAVLTLENPVELNDNVNIIFLPEYCLSLTCITGLSKPNLLVRVIGWGATLPEGNIESKSNQLKEVDIPVITNEQCENAMNLEGQVTSRMICAGYKKGGKDACTGDSGGPLFVYTKNIKAGMQAGIVSWGGDTCAQAKNYGVYTRIANPEINRFIREEMNK